MIDHPFDPADPFPTTYDYEEPIIPTPSSIAELTGLHRAGKRDFLDQRRMGFVASFRQAVEFHAHQFAKPPKSPTLKLVRLELMSLLKQTTPRVYVSRHLPSMTELPTVPTRPLDDFEARVLPRLTAEEDVVIESTPTHTRMLGSLRAGNQCLECHSVERGDLLGVFSYVLQP
ncbi:MAG: hypothetical protein O3A00_17345 [Planctomycetota bacterium]|nr:hypothetical protein [Planctomycetota bacterium]